MAVFDALRRKKTEAVVLIVKITIREMIWEGFINGLALRFYRKVRRMWLACGCVFEQDTKSP